MYLCEKLKLINMNEENLKKGLESWLKEELTFVNVCKKFKLNKEEFIQFAKKLMDTIFKEELLLKHVLNVKKRSMNI